jgi:predicted dehydrogenase
LAGRFAPQAAVYDEYEELVHDGAVEVVSLCMPNYLHAAEAITALEAGKHLILEKPPAINWQELYELRSAAVKAPGRSVVSYVMRWHPMVANLKGIIDGGGIGSIYYAQADYWHGIQPSFSSYEWIRKKEYAGGSMITGGCHAADILRYLTGKEVEEVSAYRCRARQDFDYFTTMVAAVRHVDHTVGKLSVSLDGLAFPYQFNIDILGTEGAVRDNRVYSQRYFPRQNDWTMIPSATPNSGEVGHHPFAQEIDDLVTCIRQGTPVLSDIEDGLRSIAVSLAIEEAAATGKPVRVPRWEDS